MASTSKHDWSSDKIMSALHFVSALLLQVRSKMCLDLGFDVRAIGLALIYYNDVTRSEAQAIRRTDQSEIGRAHV